MFAASASYIFWYIFSFFEEGWGLKLESPSWIW